MTKVKLYCPKTMGTFKMMFGFDQPIKFILDNRKKNGKTKNLQNNKVGIKIPHQE
tara:strand:- start:466 stop:630 length:165 start_codon:yes stop_codon:yes gene_type:complete